MIILAWDAIRKHHRLGDLNNGHLCLTIFEAGKCKLKVPAWLSSDECFPDLQTGALLLCPDAAKRSSGVSSFSYKGNPIIGAPSS